MSRIGNLPIEITQGVKIDINNLVVRVEGPKGKLSMNYHPEITVEMKDQKIILTRANENKKTKSLHGLYRNLINNMIQGVTTGFKRVLIINGVGYRAEKKGKIIVFNLGYSNPIEYPIPEDVSIDVETNNKLVVSSHNKERLGQICAEIKKFKLPEPYKGKGIRFENEHIRKKVGKTGVK